MRYLFEDCDRHEFTLGESCPACRAERAESDLLAARREIERLGRELALARPVVEAALKRERAEQAVEAMLAAHHGEQEEPPDAPAVFHASIYTDDELRSAIRVYVAAKEQP